MRELEHLRIPLSGTDLIEASAGTGKTYAIALLYLRMLVELQLAPEQILVVTYTEAATKELRGRIRNRIREALAVIDGAGTEDPLLQALCANSNGLWGDRGQVHDILERALVSFDTASIFTIHAFCLRALQEHAFESGSRYDMQLVTDQTGLLREVVDDFWRRSFFGENASLLAAVLRNGHSVDSLRRFVNGMVGNPHLKLLPDFHQEQLESLEAVCEACFCRLQQEWQARGREIMTLISTDKGLARSEKAYRADLLPELFEQMDLYAAGDNPYAVPRHFVKFCRSGIVKGTKPTGIAPEDPFFLLCEQLQQAVHQRLSAFLGELISYCNQQLPLRKQQKNIRFFDDLLNDLYQALCSESGPEYAAKLRSTYRAAMIDEFQDTDPVQYQIFQKIFANTAVPLFLIGDPKQAIYSFRGADIFAYMQAAAELPVERRFTLTSNWRSAPDLLSAFNLLFADEKNPFIYDSITYHPVLAGRDSGITLSDPSGVEEPLQICLMPSEGLNVSRATALIPDHLAAELSRLLQEGAEGRAMIGDRPVEPGDCAVIVKSHRQAASIRDALARLSIPAVLRSTISIYETEQAREVAVLLAALQNPGSEPSVRAALVTELLGCSGNDIAALFDHEQAWEECLARFRDYHQLWHDRGFMVMIRTLLSRESVRGRLLKYQDGERRLTNLLHCLELVHAKSHERGLGMDGLVSWFCGQLANGERSEEHEIRLETDELAVRIVTVHVSKGLEYPVVFCPFLWGGIIESDGPVTFHDQYTMVKDYGSPDLASHRLQAGKEQLAENLRLLYVAVTRAKYRCYLYTGKVVSSSPRSRPETSAIAYLLHASLATRAATDPVAALATEYLALSADQMHQQLEQLAACSEGIAVNCLSDELPDLQTFTGRAGDGQQFSNREFQGTIRHDWRVSSFTSFAAHDNRGGELPDRDESCSSDPALHTKPDADGGMTIFNFPKGSQAGIFIHAIFEELDFTDCSEQTVAALAAGCLDRYGFDQGWLPCLTDMVRNVVTTPFAAENGSFCLADLKQGSWLTELEFFFPLSFITADELRRVLHRHSGGCRTFNLDAVRALLQFRPTQGVVRGFMDMVFEHGGRYYLLDWKSNHLGYSAAAYDQPTVKREMEQNLYPLQYLLYTVALNRYLALRVKEYDYRKHFGGVFYLFVRGMQPQQGEQFGVYRDLPAPELIDDLTACLMASGGQGL